MISSDILAAFIPLVYRLLWVLAVLTLCSIWLTIRSAILSKFTSNYCHVMHEETRKATCSPFFCKSIALSRSLAASDSVPVRSAIHLGWTLYVGLKWYAVKKGFRYPCEEGAITSSFCIHPSHPKFVFLPSQVVPILIVRSYSDMIIHSSSPE